MDARRFDSLTKRWGTRLSRRDAVRLGAGAMLGAAGLSAARVAAQQDAASLAAGRFVSLAFYPFDGDFDEAKTALKPLIRLMQQQPGFITMSFIEGDEAIYLVTAFLDKTTSDTGMAALEEWIGASGQAVLAGEPERDSGAVFLRSELPVGCWCRIDDENACGSDDLYCCAAPDDDQGICLTVATICPGTQDEETEDDEEDPIRLRLPRRPQLPRPPRRPRAAPAQGAIASPDRIRTAMTDSHAAGWMCCVAPAFACPAVRAAARDVIASVRP